MNPLDLFKPNPYTYKSPEVPKVPASKPQEAVVAPGLSSPTQLGEGLREQAWQDAYRTDWSQRRGIDNGVYGRMRMAPLLREEARTGSQIRVDENKAIRNNYTDNQLRLGGQTFNQGLTVADRYVGLGKDTNDRVSTAVTGEQTNDAARLQLMRDVLMKPKGFTETLFELTGAIAPIVSLFV
jgi:hypothetical protein